MSTTQKEEYLIIRRGLNLLARTKEQLAAIVADKDHYDLITRKAAKRCIRAKRAAPSIEIEDDQDPEPEEERPPEACPTCWAEAQRRVGDDYGYQSIGDAYLSVCKLVPCGPHGPLKPADNLVEEIARLKEGVRDLRRHAAEELEIAAEDEANARHLSRHLPGNESAFERGPE